MSKNNTYTEEEDSDHSFDTKCYRSCSNQEKFLTMLSNSTSEELRDDLVNIHSTLGLITALVLTLTAPPDNTYKEEIHDDSIWKDNPETGREIYGILLWIATVSCFFTLVVSVLIIFQLAQVPKEKTKAYALKVGFIVMFLAPLLGCSIGTVVFIFAALIQVSLSHTAWVFWFSLAFLLFNLAFVGVFWPILGLAKMEIYMDIEDEKMKAAELNGKKFAVELASQKVDAGGKRIAANDADGAE